MIREPQHVLMLTSRATPYPRSYTCTPPPTLTGRQFGILPPKVVPVAQTEKHLPRKERKELKSFHTSAFSPCASLGDTAVATAGADALELVGPSDLSVPWGTAQLVRNTELGDSLDLNRGATASSPLATDAEELFGENWLEERGARLSEDAPHPFGLARLVGFGMDAQREPIHGQLPAERVGEDEGWKDNSRSSGTGSGVLGVLASGVASLSSPLRSWLGLVDFHAGGCASRTSSDS